jgi:hypothetical protein
MPTVGAAEFTLRVDSDFLTFNSISGAFSVIGSTPWENVNDNVWEATFTLFGTPLSGNANLFDITFNIQNGIAINSTTKIEIFDVQLAYGASYINGLYNDDITVKFVGLRHDLNGDGFVNLLDISIAATYFMVTKDDPQWTEASIADVNDDGIVDIEDLIQILLNYT